ncbi:uncharacterized protein TM35_000043910 [Trypanosoma theileri]|uniref:Uncharacterized protein n=1 Tax=Trypanosoma theileri TaxID=67003 RepID=A0A1X0P5G4_9TRYP|nr:uncharacterized protein TM35_000043910 [Trypanosoma theileri]ORC92177.1 hypothetical protein TM35_000043910 [Trypanosoma theileri]
MEERRNFVLTNDTPLQNSLTSRSGKMKTVAVSDVKSSVEKAGSVLPTIPAASQQPQSQSQQLRSAKNIDASKNPLALLASESRATAQRNIAQGRWRSALLEHEVALKELVTNNMATPPTALRLMKTFQTYDAVTRVVEDQSPELAQLMKMFRIEFSRATFTRQSLDAVIPQLSTSVTNGNNNNKNNNNNNSKNNNNTYVSVNDDDTLADRELGLTYFEQVDVLLRENAALRMEVALGNTREAMATLSKKAERLEEMVDYYENEVGRLERENERSAESYRRARKELDEQQQLNIQLRDRYDDERQRLQQDNKDMQLRLCRLRKYIGERESTVVRDAYKSFKDKKIGVMTQLFDAGDERVAVLVMLSQLESRVNEALDEYDKEFLLCEETERAEQQKRMLSVVSVLLEEMHLSEERYLRLLPHRKQMLTGEEQDETDAYVSLLTDSKMYTALMARVTAQEEKLAATATNTTLTNITAAAAGTLIDGEITTPPHSGSEDTLAVMSIHGNDGKETEAGASLTPSSVNSSAQLSRISEIKFTNMRQRRQQKQKQEKGGGGGGEEQSTSRKEEKTEKEEKQPQEQEQQQQQQQQPETTEERKDSQEQTVPQESPEVVIHEATADALSIVKQKQKEWVLNIFGAAVDTTNLLKRIKEHGACEGNKTEQEQLLRHFISHPMLDVSNNKFQCGIDLYAGPSQQTQAFLCSVMDIDPVLPLHIPQGTNFMHVKYRNPMRLETTRELTDEEAVAEAAAATLTALDTVDEWGGRTSFMRTQKNESETSPIPDLVQNSTIFNQLTQSTGQKAATKGAAATSSSSTAATVFERLNPLSPNRSPEWLLYQSMFGGYRPLTPRLIDMACIDHILLNSCERHFDRAEERYMRCIRQARGRATNTQMTLNMAERFFKESYVLTDFQESIIRELESRYCYPELVAKTLYEILCYLDATMTSQPLVDLYLSCIRGFESPTRIHYITFVLNQLSINWPSSNPDEAVLKDDVLTLLEYIYRSSSQVTAVDASEILTEYQMATRSAPITLTSLRQYLVTAMLHFEDPLLLYFNGLLSFRATSSAVVEMNYEQFEFALKDKWEEKIEGKLLIRYLAASCGFNKKVELTTKELACVAASMWSSKLWTNM